MQEVEVNGYVYRRLPNGTFIPDHVYERVKQSLGSESDARRGRGDISPLRGIDGAAAVLRGSPVFGVFCVAALFAGKVHCRGRGRIFYPSAGKRDPPFAVGAERVLGGQADFRFYFCRSAVRVYADRGRGISAQRDLANGFCHGRSAGRSPRGYPGNRCSRC